MRRIATAAAAALQVSTDEGPHLDANGSDREIRDGDRTGSGTDMALLASQIPCRG